MLAGVGWGQEDVELVGHRGVTAETRLPHSNAAGWCAHELHTLHTTQLNNTTLALTTPPPQRPPPTNHHHHQKQQEKHVETAKQLLGEGPDLTAFVSRLMDDMGNLKSMLQAICIGENKCYLFQ